MLKVDGQISIPKSELTFTFARSPGPGGQNVNKVNTKAVLRWNVVASDSLPPGVKQRFRTAFANRISQTGDLVLASHEYRDQSRNIAQCLEKLRTMILKIASAPKRRVVTRPTAGAKRRRLSDKKRQGEKKQSRHRGSADE